MAFDNLKKPELVAALGEFYAMNVDLNTKIAKLEHHLEKQAETICDLYEEKVELLKRLDALQDELYAAQHQEQHEAHEWN